MNRAAVAIFLALVCSGCPKRLDFGPRGRITQPEELFRLTREAQDVTATLQGDGKLRVESPQGTGTVSVFPMRRQVNRCSGISRDFISASNAVRSPCRARLSKHARISFSIAVASINGPCSIPLTESQGMISGCRFFEFTP